MTSGIVGIDCNGRWLDLSKAAVMGILNITPDSFSDGGQLMESSALQSTAEEMIRTGCAIFDVGGESTRPGAHEVSVEDECRRVIPVVEYLHNNHAIPISIDTSKAEVMQLAVEAGAGFINDVRALREPGALEAATELNVPVCLMHMQGEPRTMQKNPSYSDDVVEDVIRFLTQRIEAALANGMRESNIVLDPGFGFGKTLEHNLALFKGLERLAKLGFPLLVGVSRKAMIGQLTDLAATERDTATAALTLLAAQRGAKILRVHNVAANAQVLTMLTAIEGGQ